MLAVPARSSWAPTRQQSRCSGLGLKPCGPANRSPPCQWLFADAHTYVAVLLVANSCLCSFLETKSSPFTLVKVEIVYYDIQMPHGALELCKHPRRSVFCGGNNLSSDRGTAGSKGLPLSNKNWFEFISVRSTKMCLDSVIPNSEASLPVLSFHQHVLD